MKKRDSFLIGAALLLFITSISLYADNEKSKKVLGRIGRTVILADPPESSPLQQHLTRAEMEENFENLVQAVDRYFSFFLVKDIQWESICNEYRQKLKETRSTTRFYRLVDTFISELKDAHSWLQDYKPRSKLDVFAPPISIRRIEGKPAVVDVWRKSKAYREGVRPGWVITAIDHKPVNSYMRLLRNRVSVSSSERNLQEKITRMILCGKKESMVSLDFVTNEGKRERGMRYARTVRYPKTEPELPFDLIKLDKIWYGTHSSGFGYIRIISFVGRMELADEFDRALAALRDTKGLIIDIRDNPGGYGTCQKRIIGRFLSSEAQGITSFRRNGPEHDDFEMIPELIRPSGDWQYTKPLGLLMNSITGSASDLFAARFVSSGRVVTMGQTTHGNVTGVGVYVALPCNLVVRISNGYIADSNGRIIEGNGNEPEIIIEPTIADARQYIDGVLERAFTQLQKKPSS